MFWKIFILNDNYIYLFRKVIKRNNRKTENYGNN